jgi:hypothetical protein
MNCPMKSKTKALVIAGVMRLRSVGRAVGQLTVGSAWAKPVSGGKCVVPSGRALSLLANWRITTR